MTVTGKGYRKVFGPAELNGGYLIQSVDARYISAAAAGKYKREFASDEIAVLRIPWA